MTLTAIQPPARSRAALHFDLPPALEASSPPEARGLTRDAVRMLVAHRGDGSLVHATFSEFPQFLEEGDLVVVNTSGTLAAELDVGDPGADGLVVHLSTRLPADLWTVELRRAGQPVLRGPAGGSPRAAGRRVRHAAHPVRHPSRGRAAVGRLDQPPRAAPHLPVRPRPSHPLRLRPGRVADRDVPERLRHRARVGRDAERRPSVHARGPHPSRRPRRRGRAHPAAHRRGLTRGGRGPLSRVLPGRARRAPSGSTTPVATAAGSSPSAPPSCGPWRPWSTSAAR